MEQLLERRKKLLLVLLLGGPGSGGAREGAGRKTGGDRMSKEMTESESQNQNFMRIHNDLQSRGDLTPYERYHIVPLARAYTESTMALAHGDSNEKNSGTVNGYTAERAALHDEIVGHYMSQFTAPQEHPNVLITGGLPGAGKTSGLQDMDLRGYTKINADDIKEMLPEYKGGSGAAYLHEESSHIASIVTERAIAARQNIVQDVTMKSYGDPSKGVQDNIAGTITRYGQEGYNVHLQFTDVHVNTAIERVMNRYGTTGRFVPPDYIRDARSPLGTNSKNFDTFTRVRDFPQVTSWHLRDGVTGETVAKSGKTL